MDATLNTPRAQGENLGGALYALHADALRLHEDVMAHLAAAVFRDTAQERQAVQTGCFAVQGQTFCVQVEPWLRQLVVRCRLPAMPVTATLMRAMLEFNLAAGAQGMVFGLAGTAAGDVIEATLRCPLDALAGSEALAGAMLVQRLSDAVCQTLGLAPVMALVDVDRWHDPAPVESADAGHEHRFAQLTIQLSRDMAVHAEAGAGGPVVIQVEGLCVAASHEPGSGLFGLHADMGLPDESAGMEGLAHLLRANAAGTYAPVVFGLHPVSGRRVACLHLPVGALDAPLCREFATTLAVMARNAAQAATV